MTMYALIVNNQVSQYPLTEREVREAFPNVSFPTAFEPPENYVPVVPTEAPAFDALTQSLAEGAPVLSNGAWQQTWLISALPANVAGQNVFAAVQVAVQERLDEFARTRGYDGILSAATYAASSVAKFQPEGQYCVDARDAHWAACYQLLAQVQAGNWPTAGAGGLPTVQDVLAAMPALEWPL